MASISDFLDKLASDPELAARYDTEPGSVMSEAGLSDDQQLLLLQGSTAEVRDALTAELQEGTSFGPDTVAVVFVLRMSPAGAGA